MTALTEADVEQFAPDLLRANGWAATQGPDIAPARNGSTMDRSFLMGGCLTTPSAS